VEAAETYAMVSAKTDRVTTFAQANPEGKLIRKRVVPAKGTEPND
jgi:hypothetical protein